MRLHRPLDDIFANGGQVRALRALFAMPPGWEASAREIARRAGVAHPTALRALGSLADQGILTLTKTPSADRYQVNEAHIATERLRMLFAWEGALMGDLVSFLGDRLGQVEPPVTAAFIFGSTARAGEGLRSDLDLGVVCARRDVEKMEDGLESVVEQVGRRFGLWLHVIVGGGSLDALTRSGTRGYRLWRSIRREGIPVMGGAA